MPPVVRAAGLEPAREPGLSRPPLPIGLRAHGAGGRIRTDNHGGLSSADKPILVRRHNLVARPGFEPGKSLPSEGSAFTNLTSGPMVSKMGFEPTGTAFSGLRVYQLRHLDIVVGSAGVEPTSERGDRVQGYSLLPLPLGQLPKLNISCQRSDS